MKVKLFADVEGDFYYKIPSPHFSKTGLLKWKLNKILGRAYRYPQPSREGLKRLVGVFRKFNAPVTFCIVGHLYLKECSGWKHFDELKPRNPWFRDKIGADWYYWDRGGDFRKNPGLYFGDYIEREMKNVKNFRFGLHAFSHEALSLENEEVIESIIKAGIAAAGRLGIKIESFAAPFEMLRDAHRPSGVLKILKKYNIKDAQYAGYDDGLKIMRKLDFKKPEIFSGVKLFWITNYIEGTDSSKKIRRIIRELREFNVPENKDKVYCLSMHDFTWKSTRNIERIMEEIRRLKIKIE
jgi:peptidoglycan/xylan/chitin deacetylase (PgdA/CDA1 family)